MAGLATKRTKSDAGGGETPAVIRISVRALVEFLFRSGDIDEASSHRDRLSAMQEGARVHRKIQQSMGADYAAEVPLSYAVNYPDYTLLVEGRADGIFSSYYEASRFLLPKEAAKAENLDDGDLLSARVPVIDEIKGVYRDVLSMEEPEPLHIYQAKCYAFMYAVSEGIGGGAEAFGAADVADVAEISAAAGSSDAAGASGRPNAAGGVTAAGSSDAEIGVQMTYVNLDHQKDVVRFAFVYSLAEIKSWFSDVLSQYKRWSDMLYYHRIERQESIRGLLFPFEYRPGQRELAGTVYRTIADGARTGSRSFDGAANSTLFIQAPTGTGKTISTVFPAVKAVGENLAETCFYLTAKTVTRRVAMETYTLLTDRGYRGKTVEITAKDSVCVLTRDGGERKCNPDDCPRAKGHFDRVNDALYEILNANYIFSREAITTCAEKFSVCPFELTLDITSFSDNIICDYNYVFDPNVYLKRFFAEGTRGAYLFLIDEAHNLVERAREMYSETLVKEEFLSMKRFFQRVYPAVAKSLEKSNRVLLSMKKDCDRLAYYDEKSGSQADFDALLFAVTNVATAMERMFDKRSDIAVPDEVMEFYFRVRNFLSLADGSLSGYRIYGDYGGNGEFRLHLACLDPSERLQSRLNSGVATVLFSATLLPIRYYKKLLCRWDGGSSGADGMSDTAGSMETGSAYDTSPRAVYAETVFSPSQRALMIGRDVTTLYKKRSDGMYLRYAQYILEIASKRRGNYMVFFPSYAFLEKVFEKIVDLLGGADLDANLADGSGADLSDCSVGGDPTVFGNYIVIRQTSKMSETERAAFLDEFETERDKTLLAFCVMGGIFAEGIDLREERLIGAIIVGTGLPQVSTEREVLQTYFDARNEDGFSYAYLYPGMNKVEQAAGRVIRTVSDVGVIALLDERFLYQDYRNTFPREWSDAEVCTLDTVGETVAKFWEERSVAK